MFLQILSIVAKFVVYLSHSYSNISFCDSLEIDESNSGKESDLKDEKLDLKDNELDLKETPKQGVFSRIQGIFSRIEGIGSGIWNYPLVQNKLFTVKVSHIMTSAFYFSLFMGGVHEGINIGVNLVTNESYAPLLKKILVSPHQAFNIINYQLYEDKFLKKAVELARTTMRDRTQ